MRRGVAEIALAGLLTVWTASAPALDPGKALTQYVRDAWQPEQGLPQSSVTAILQTRDGYLWLGTQEGLVKFDGVRFTVFDTRSTPELGHNFVLTLLEDREGRLWIGTYGGLARLERGTFSRFTTAQGLPNDQVRALCETRKGQLFAGTLGGGIARLEGERFVPEPATKDLPGKRVRALVEDGQGALWIATDDGLGSLQGGVLRHLATKDGLTHKDLRALFLDAEGTLWIGTDGGGLNRLKDGRITALTTKDGLSHDVVRSLSADRAGNLYIGTWGGGLDRLSGGRLSALGTRDGLPSDQIWATYEDREGSLWVGTDGGGLHRLKDAPFTALTKREGLTNDIAMTVLEDRSGALWVGTYGGGLDRLAPDGRVTAFTAKTGLANDTVQALHEGRDGTLWVGTSGGGLQKFVGGQPGAVVAGLPSDQVRSLLEDREGTLWVGTDGGGLAHVKDGKVTVLTERNGLSLEVVLALLEDRAGNLWIGTDGSGLGRLKDGELTAFGKREGLAHDIVSALYEDADGSLWIGTSGGGLGRLKNGKLAFVSRKDGLFDDSVFTILEDAAGSLWMTCNKGVFRVSRSEAGEVMDGKRQKLASTSYGIADGLQSVECNAGSPAGFRARDGRLWFGTIRGVAVVNPVKLEGNPLEPPVAIEEILVDGRLVAASGNLRLPPGTHSLEVHYTALSLRTPGRVRFRYRLAGFDDEWIDAGARRTAYYTNLPHGEKVFQVLASNDAGLWNEEGAKLAITVEPRLLERNPVRLLLAVASVGLLWGAHRARLWRLRARERELVAVVEERTRSLREEKERTERALAEAEEHERRAEAASQAKSTFLANMSHELRTPLNAVLGFNQLLERDAAITGESREGLGIIQRSGEHLLGLINDVLSISKIEAGRLTLDARPFDLHELLESVVAMVRVRAEAKEGKDLEVLYESAGVPRGVRGDDLKLRQVLVNLLGNAVKFTERGHVLLRARWAAGRAVLEVEDTGPGIASEQVAKLFAPFVQTESGRKAREGTGLGLVISRQIARLMDGDITVASTPGRGTTFRLDVALPEAVLEKAPERGRVVGLAEGQEAPRILVVDDENENRLLLTRLLRSVGFSVSEAANGALAIEEWRAFRPHAVFMDMRMPVMDGVEATRHIRAEEAGSPRSEGRTVILALTASVFEHERAEILDSGSDDFLMKPFRVETVLDKLAAHLGVRYRHATVEPASPGAGERSGFDVADGLRRAGGNEALYRQLVSGFREEAAEVLPRLRELLGKGDREGARHVLHTLKGTAATLGARRLARAAAELEVSLDGLDDVPPREPSLEGLAASLEDVLAGTDRVVGRGDVNATQAVTRPRDSAEAALALVDRLAALVAAGDLAAADRIAELRSALGPDASDLLGKLERAVDRLDFEKASGLLAGVRARVAASGRENIAEGTEEPPLGGPVGDREHDV